MKKLINDPMNVVPESLEGMAKAHPDLIKVHFNPNFVYRADAPRPGKVAVISGGGSGHEPMHVGFVGYGMLDAACPGAVFTSPTPDQMYEAAKMVHGGAGILMIVKNYAGDVMNFDMAADLLRGEGFQVESVLIADDVAVESSLYSQGRRGTGTTVLAEKILGAAAERGYDLQRLAALGRRIAENGRSMGMALTSCTVPHVGRPTFELGPDEMEIGIGIHGEPGRYREPLKNADAIVERLMEPILTDLPFKAGDRVICMVNSMGGTPISELYIVYRKVAEICEKAGVQIVRNLIGAYITSLEMAGTSITLLRADDEMLELWDHPVKTPALRWGM
ncbi:dihydroxyacetone kinase subunit DhaK [Thermoflexus sp.]|uniref:dihydroxyacetone kinase subunit DhaK n=1 Tax=Thermoflexus sp. TaxID=1969742 RepID=UPI0025E27A8B|nr:dihydroxyacetone kinase subunit DhaK [Thermoflexus sp.]MDW8180667.1 dihydroxyacetone kinase subunit DhaK [Anaerolineae bacterium]MCS6964703.1 dihydroxyacetone kinase subunit DhaK [Thermoflexus sp.]MCS7351213.1 dihydroxyacetone kinase subunit DhaK [Thermoflexus sp.]MCX7690958.1 dihydroxyacetone kinase subunit DhaK [Thermoflexus sp.]MDW8184126.1 dihydroxyacetone kinase subunit DhaK [Anaerolineae bacterium]